MEHAFDEPDAAGLTDLLLSPLDAAELAKGGCSWRPRRTCPPRRSPRSGARGDPGAPRRASRSTSCRRNRERIRRGTMYRQRANRTGHASFSRTTVEIAAERRSQFRRSRCELPSSGLRERIELRAPVVLARTPLGGDPAFLLQLVERRIERAVADAEDVLREKLEALAEAQPFIGSSASILRISRSRVPWTRSVGRLMARLSVTGRS